MTNYDCLRCVYSAGNFWFLYKLFQLFPFFVTLILTVFIAGLKMSFGYFGIHMELPQCWKYATDKVLLQISVNFSPDRIAVRARRA